MGSAIMSNLLKMMAGSASPLYVDDVFSSFVYSGNGSTQTITNGIDLAGEGGLVWTKSRNNATYNVLSFGDGGITINDALYTNTNTRDLGSSRIASQTATGYILNNTEEVN